MRELCNTLLNFALLKFVKFFFSKVGGNEKTARRSRAIVKNLDSNMFTKIFNLEFYASMKVFFQKLGKETWKTSFFPVLTDFEAYCYLKSKLKNHWEHLIKILICRSWEMIFWKFADLFIWWRNQQNWLLFMIERRIEN